MPQEYPFRLIPGRHRDRVLARYLASIDLPHLIDDIEHTSAELLDDEETNLSILQTPMPAPPPLPPSDFLAGAALLREAAFMLDDKPEVKEKTKEDKSKFLLYNATKLEISKEAEDFGKDRSEHRKEFVTELLVSSMFEDFSPKTLNE
ncbi:hypothetical protein QE152_g39049 [Popillia japonica]|uniref:Uncharacterized protein n=1 Tax=Popillia japonica TaxID=7064 RepID=A0AAW1HV31_POPJA